MDTLAWLAKLISFDTTSHRSNLALIHEVKSYLESEGLKIRLTYDAEKNKANLFASLPAQSGSLEGGLLLSGHTDVVPVEGQVWDTNPFEAIQKEGRIYGRGTSDMKGFLAVLLGFLPTFKKETLTKPLHFAFSYDEEVGCHGAPLLIADMQAAGITPEACIVGEPSNMEPIVAHKGICLFRASLKGRAAHSSLTPKGCNAIEYAAKLINFIRSLADNLKQEGPFDKHYDVPFTSISVNRILGGVADNIIPETCEFIFECRHLPEAPSKAILEKIKTYAKELENKMKEEAAEASISIQSIASIPGFERAEEVSFYQLAKKLCKQTEKRKVAYATEAGLFERAHIPTIICGPGSITEAHRPNEYISINQLKDCEHFLTNFIKQYNTLTT